MPNLMIVIASTRPGRAGLPVANWFESVARDHGGFDVTVVDLLELDLPFMNEPNHPALGKYEHDHTKDWAAQVGAADAFVFVHPEYNHAITAPLKNAIDYLGKEWAYKPIGLVSYGGVAAGQRAAGQIRQVMAPLRAVITTDGVMIPFVKTHIDDHGEFDANEMMLESAHKTLDELVKLEQALRPLRD
jgi:NAD(P)H-dependent FMN reductase